MKITRLDAIPLKGLAIGQDFSTASVLLNHLHFVLVRIETDAGIEGFGEALPAWEVTGETAASVVGCVGLYQDASRLHAKDLLIGREIGSLAAIRAMMDDLLPAERPFTVAGNPAAKAAIEQAALDACARLHGVSIPRLLGIAATPVASALTCGFKPVEATLSWLEDALKCDPPLIRLKVGSAVPPDPSVSSVERDIAVIKGARHMIRSSGKAAMLSADANEAFIDAEGSIAFCRRIEGQLDWLEQPALGKDRLAFSAIRAKTSVPLMADESLVGFGDAQLLIRAGGVDYFNVKMMKEGGVLAALRIIDLAAQHGIRCHIGSMIETSLGCLMGYCAAAARPGQVVGTDMLAFELLGAEPFGLLTNQGGRVTLADAAVIGTGVTFDRAKALALRPPCC